MKIMKFGGGVLKTAEAVGQLADIVSKTEKPSVIVVSALDKTTNRLEDVLKEFVKNNIPEALRILNEIYQFHKKIESDAQIEAGLQSIFDEIESIIQNEEFSGEYDYEYDRIVSQGEVLSSKIISSALRKKEIENEWIDIRNVIITDCVHREAGVDWEHTQTLAERFFKEDKIYVTQGFIGTSHKGKTTTLGREGSDFTAAVLAFTLNAKEITFWKDVRGIYNSDPSIMPDSVLIPKLAFQEAVEQVYYGAKILHPKTIKPLQNKRIKVFVRPFHEPSFTGTEIVDISEEGKDFFPHVPVYIFKENQILISVSPRDLSFIAEKNMGTVFVLLAKYRIKAHLTENTAISFSICTDYNKHKIEPLIDRLKKDFIVRYNTGLQLITVRHYDNFSIERVTKEKNVFIEQKSRHTVRFVVK